MEAGAQQRPQRARTVLKVCEKRLSADLWRCDGQEYKGSHFPICAFTNNVGRRSAERLAARAKRPQTRGDWQGQPGVASRSRGDASWATGCGGSAAGPAREEAGHGWGEAGHGWGGWNACGRTWWNG